MQEIGMTGAELRVIDGKNILDLTNEELKRTKDILDRARLKVVSIASPLLKCVLEAVRLSIRVSNGTSLRLHTLGGSTSFSGSCF